MREQISAGSETCLVRCAVGARSRAGAREGGLDYTVSLIKNGFLYDQQNAALLLLAVLLANVFQLPYISRTSIVRSSFFVWLHETLKWSVSKPFFKLQSFINLQTRSDALCF